MINLRKIILQRNINNHLITDISFRKIKSESNSESGKCYICNFDKTKISNKNIIIHNQCLRLFDKCSENKCGILYSKVYKINFPEEFKENIYCDLKLKKVSSEYYPVCSLCGKIYCEYHLTKLKNNLICNWCQNNFKYYSLFILRKTLLYKNEDILCHILKFLIS